MIEFAGIRSDERNLIVEHYPQRFFPKRKYNAQVIPGGDKDFIIDEGEDAFSNYSQPYSVFFDSKGPGLSQASRHIAEWLLGNPGYQRLEDSYDPDFYRLAYYSGGEQFLNYFNEYGRGTLTFTCAPKRFYKSGETQITLTNGITLYSPSKFKAWPLVEFVCAANTDEATLTITDKDGTAREFKVYNSGSGTLSFIIDPRRHTAVSRTGTARNPYVLSPYEDLYLSEESTITWSSQLTSVKLTPRWWTI